MTTKSSVDMDRLHALFISGMDFPEISAELHVGEGKINQLIKAARVADPEKWPRRRRGSRSNNGPSEPAPTTSQIKATFPPLERSNGSANGPVTTRQMTDEERERYLVHTKPTDSSGKAIKAPVVIKDQTKDSAKEPKEKLAAEPESTPVQTISKLADEFASPTETSEPEGPAVRYVTFRIPIAPNQSADDLRGSLTHTADLLAGAVELDRIDYALATEQLLDAAGLLIAVVHNQLQGLIVEGDCIEHTLRFFRHQNKSYLARTEGSKQP